MFATQTTIARTGLGPDAFQTPNFPMIVKNYRGAEKRITAHIVIWGEEIFVGAEAPMLKDSYTAEDRAEGARLAAADPVRDGDQIEVNGTAYTVKVKGDYSDPAVLILV